MGAEAVVPFAVVEREFGGPDCGVGEGFSGGKGHDHIAIAKTDDVGETVAVEIGNITRVSTDCKFAGCAEGGGPGLHIGECAVLKEPHFDRSVAFEADDVGGAVAVYVGQVALVRRRRGVAGGFGEAVVLADDDAFE